MNGKEAATKTFLNEQYRMNLNSKLDLKSRQFKLLVFLNE
jgi:hypothetical protein